MTDKKDTKDKIKEITGDIYNVFIQLEPWSMGENKLLIQLQSDLGRAINEFYTSNIEKDNPKEYKELKKLLGDLSIILDQASLYFDLSKTEDSLDNEKKLKSVIVAYKDNMEKFAVDLEKFINNNNVDLKVNRFRTSYQGRFNP